jgi:hypothetical protein
MCCNTEKVCTLSHSVYVFAWCLLHAYFLLGFPFDREDGGDMLLQNFDELLPDCTALYPRRLNSYWSPL